MSEPTSVRVPCRNEGCSNLILPATAAANDGFCAPCVQKRDRDEREKFIRENRREVNQYEGLTDAVEIIQVLHTERKYDPLIVYAPEPKAIEVLYGEIDESGAERLMDTAILALQAGNNRYATSIAQGLAALTDFRLDRLLHQWVKNRELRPAVIFRGAGANVRNAVIEALQTGRVNTNEALSALAWIGDEVVQRKFRQWDAEAASWKKSLHIKPSEYSKVAGWELANGARRNLYHSECLAMMPAEEGQAVDRTVELMKEGEDRCPWCKRTLIHLIELDLTDGRFAFLRINFRRFAVLTCDACTCFTTIFASLVGDGRPRWSEFNQRPEYLPDDSETWLSSPWQNAAVTLRPRRAREAEDWCMELSISQIGGMPSWVQDFQYPKCPQCTRTMGAVGQVDNGAFPGNEGECIMRFCATTA